MLIDEFLCKREVLGKRAPHSFTPPPLSVVGVSNNVSSPLNLAPATSPLPKFKEHLPRFSGNNIVTTNEHLVAFSNVCHNIGAHDNDTCMCLFVNSLEGKVVADFFDLPPNILSTWEELVYWFKSTYGQSKHLVEQL
jgi:hypothetical protein